MSSPSIDQVRGSKAPSVTELVAETPQIDLAHAVIGNLLSEEGAGNEPARLDFGDLAILDRTSPWRHRPILESINRQVEAQAMQLGEHLAAGSRNSIIARRNSTPGQQLDRDACAARLWLKSARLYRGGRIGTRNRTNLQDEAVCRKAEELALREQHLEALDSELATQHASAENSTSS